MIPGSDHLAEVLASVAERAARALWPLVGAGTHEEIDEAAVTAIRAGLTEAGIDARVVVCEGAKDRAPMLEIGETFGAGDAIDLAIDPVDGTRAVATAAPGAIVAIAAAGPGGFLRAETSYVDKLAVGPGAAAAIDLAAPIEDNLDAVAAALGRPVESLRVAVLERERNRELAARIRARGARVLDCAHADLAATVAVGLGRIDLAAGVSGSPEAVIAAAALGCLGGRLVARPWHGADSAILDAADLARPPLCFAAAGVTESALLARAREVDGLVAIETLALATSAAP
jgi:fructose-1,6-bisphosphatase II